MSAGTSRQWLQRRTSAWGPRRVVGGLIALSMWCSQPAASPAPQPSLELGASSVLRVWAEGSPTSVCWLATPLGAGESVLPPSYPYCDHHCGVHVQDADPFSDGYQPPGDSVNLAPVDESCPFELLFDEPGQWLVAVTIQYVHEADSGGTPYETSAAWLITVNQPLLFASGFEAGGCEEWSAHVP